MCKIGEKVNGIILLWVCRIFIFIEQVKVPSVVTIRLMRGEYEMAGSNYAFQQEIVFACMRCRFQAYFQELKFSHHKNLNYTCKHTS